MKRLTTTLLLCLLIGASLWGNPLSDEGWAGPIPSFITRATLQVQIDHQNGATVFGGTQYVHYQGKEEMEFSLTFDRDLDGDPSTSESEKDQVTIKVKKTYGEILPSGYIITIKYRDALSHGLLTHSNDHESLQVSLPRYQLVFTVFVWMLFQDP